MVRNMKFHWYGYGHSLERCWIFARPYKQCGQHGLWIHKYHVGEFE